MRPFESYTWQHILPLIFFIVAGFITIRLAKTLPPKRQSLLGTMMAVTVLGLMVGGTIIKLVTGSFNYKDDLPLYLCRLIAWMLPFVIWYRNRFWLGVFYFWVFAGTLQGIITPDLAEGFPSYFYFRYWFLHAGLVVVVLYAVIIFQIRITWKDFLYSVLLAQLYVLLVHVVNLCINSNYNYTLRKPPGASLLDMMGPWPLYIFAGEGVMLVLFLVLMLPWLFRTRRI